MADEHAHTMHPGGPSAEGTEEEHHFHIFDLGVLMKTFMALVGLTVLTVVLALFERGYVAADTFGFEFALPFELPLGALSVPIALTIAGAKAAFVAANFMGLKHDKGSNLVVFLASIVFVLVMFTFTWFDTSFRDTFEGLSATPVDVLQEDANRLDQATQELAPTLEAVPLTSEPDPDLFPSAGSGENEAVPSTE